MLRLDWLFVASLNTKVLYYTFVHFRIFYFLGLGKMVPWTQSCIRITDVYWISFLRWFIKSLRRSVISFKSFPIESFWRRIRGSYFMNVTSLKNRSSLSTFILKLSQLRNESVIGMNLNKHKVLRFFFFPLFWSIHCHTPCYDTWWNKP